MNAIRGNGMPSLTRQAKNFAAAISRSAHAAANLKPVFVPKDVLSAREAICAVCDENLSGRCRQCGCGVRSQFLRKTHLATERCPLDPPKWDFYNLEK